MKVTKAGFKRFFEIAKTNNKELSLSQTITTEYFVEDKLIHTDVRNMTNNLIRKVKEVKSNRVIFDQGTMYLDQLDVFPDYLDEYRCESISTYEGEYKNIEHEGIVYDAVRYVKVKRSVYEVA